MPYCPSNRSRACSKGAMMRRQVGADSGERPAQFLAILPVPTVGERAEPLVGVREAFDRAGADDLSTLASQISRSTQLLQPTLRLRQRLTARQGPLASCFTRAINVENQVASTTAVRQLARLPVCVQRTSKQVFEEEAAQGFDRRPGERTRDRVRAPSGRASDHARRAP